MAFESFINTFFYPEQTVTCKSPSHMMILRLLPIFLQCSLLHPHFARSSTIRQIRFWITPINVYQSITIPIDYCFLPLTQKGPFNLCLGVWGFYLAMKSLEWGFTEGFWVGRYWTAEKIKSSVAVNSSPVKIGWKEISAWTLQQFFSYVD